MFKLTRERSCIPFYDPMLEVLMHHFYHVLLVTGVTSLPQFKGRGIRLFLVMGVKGAWRF